MNRTAKPAPFVLASTGHGSMIVSVNDYRPASGAEPEAPGEGLRLLKASLSEPDTLDLMLALLDLRARHFGPGVVAIDGGAGIGAQTIEWARHMTGWGKVVAFEPQERLYYALCGNIALNNVFNAGAVNAALGGMTGFIDVPAVDPTAPALLGALELRKTPRTPPIGQPVEYGGAPNYVVNLLTIDGLECERLDLARLDIGGMELEALRAATTTLKTCRPILFLSKGRARAGALEEALTEAGYTSLLIGGHILAAHGEDPGLDEIAGLAEAATLPG